MGLDVVNLIIFIPNNGEKISKEHWFFIFFHFKKNAPRYENLPKRKRWFPWSKYAIPCFMVNGKKTFPIP